MTQKFRYTLALSCLVTIQLDAGRPVIAIAATSVSLVSLYALYRIINQPVAYTPTISSMNTLTFRPAKDSGLAPLGHIDDLIKSIHNRYVPEKTNLVINNKPYTVYRGVEITPEDKTVFIYSRGYARTNILGENDNFIQHGAGAKIGHVLLSDNVVHDAPLITFDYPDDRRRFSFAQKTDIACLQTVYDAVHEKSNDADIVLVGDCRGAKVAFEVASLQPPKLKALVALSPFICARDLTNKIAHSYLNYMPLSQEILCSFFQCYFPAYDPRKDDLINRLSAIAQTVPIYIGHRSFDTLIANETIDLLMQKFQESGHSIYLTTINDTSEPHSKLTSNQEIQRSLNLFFKQYKLPYNAELIGQKWIKSAPR